MSYTLELNHHKKFIAYKHCGNITRDDIGEAWEEMLKMPEFTQEKYNLFSDYSEGVFIGTPKDVKLVSDILFELKDMLKGKKQALILSEPMSTALSILFEGEINERIGFIVKVFSTKEAAQEWLTK
ncbi:hypothetical protein EMN47_16240 [Prolixibacteraceae bacterium JC049]|nr:hypothetical protein [Prolixibacteraceae bacterium JC049]